MPKLTINLGPKKPTEHAFFAVSLSNITETSCRLKVFGYFQIRPSFSSPSLSTAYCALVYIPIHCCALGAGQELKRKGPEERQEAAQGKTQGEAQEEEEKEIPVRFRLLRQWLRCRVLELEFFKASINFAVDHTKIHLSVVEDLSQD